MKPVWLLALVLLLAGCVEQSEPLDSDAPETPQDNAPRDNTSGGGSAGEPGAPGTPGRPDADAELRVVFEQEVTASMESGGIAVTIPEEAIRVWLEVDYIHGAYRDAGFSLGECQHVSPVTGTGISVAGAHAGIMGSTTQGVMYLCGDLDGQHDLTWNLEAGAVQALVRVTAEMPAL